MMFTQTHLADNAECPPCCTRGLPLRTQLQWRLLAVPEGQEGQESLDHPEDLEDHVVQQS